MNLIVNITRSRLGANEGSFLKSAKNLPIFLYVFFSPCLFLLLGPFLAVNCPFLKNSTLPSILDLYLVTVFTKKTCISFSERVFQVKVSCKYAKEFWNYSWKPTFFKWNMLHISGITPENSGQVLKYLLLENGVELPEADGTCVRRKKKYFC